MEWYDVKERMPDSPLRWVLVAAPNWGIFMARKRIRFAADWYGDWELVVGLGLDPMRDEISAAVTHWMPAPVHPLISPFSGQSEDDDDEEEDEL
jgi:hypothetical protein